MTARLHELGYPAPRYVRVETDWAMQEELPGEPVEPEDALRSVDAGLRAAYQAHLCVRQAEWSLRRHGAATGDRMLAYALEVASAFPPA